MIEIARATIEDVDHLTPLFDKYRQFYGQAPDESAAQEYLSERIQLQQSVVFLASESGQGVGFAQLYPTFSSVSMRRVWILNDLFVDPSSRRRGIGTQLLSIATSFAREDGAVRLVLATGVENRSAQSLYQRLGWKREEGFIHFEFVA